MSWTSPKTYTANSTLTAADLNTFLRDNMLECEPAKAQNPGGYFVSTGLNTIAERLPACVYSSTAGTLTTVGSPFRDLTTGGVGPAVTVTTGAKAIVLLNVGMDSNLAAGSCWTAYGITGATTLIASVDRSISARGAAAEYKGATFLQTGLTPGSNTFTMKYFAGAGTSSCDFLNRRIAVIPL